MAERPYKVEALWARHREAWKTLVAVIWLKMKALQRWWLWSWWLIEGILGEDQVQASNCKVEVAKVTIGWRRCSYGDDVVLASIEARWIGSLESRLHERRSGEGGCCQSQHWRLAIGEDFAGKRAMLEGFFQLFSLVLSVFLFLFFLSIFFIPFLFSLFLSIFFSFFEIFFKN